MHACRLPGARTAGRIFLGFFAAGSLQQDGLRLVRMQEGFLRPTNPAYGTGFRTGFADGFPMLLAAEESLEELNSRIAAAGGGGSIGMERFRPK